MSAFDPKYYFQKICVVWLLFAVIFLVVACATGSLGKNLGVRVLAKDSGITVDWDERHLWDQKLKTRGVMLVAEYQTESRGLVRETLARTHSNGDRTLHFTLPDQLTSQPKDKICLYVQLQGERHLLPIRRATKNGDDTARFRYPGWEKAVKLRTVTNKSKKRVELLENRLKVLGQGMEAKQNALSMRGITSLDSCNTISVNRTDMHRPYDAVPPAQHNDIARRICVHRVWYSRKLFEKRANKIANVVSQRANEISPRVITSYMGSLYSVAYMVPELSKLVLETPRLAARQTQASEFLSDWKKFLPIAGEDYQPHLGKFDDTLPLNSSAQSIAFRAFGKNLAKQIGVEQSFPSLSPVSSHDIAGLVGAALDIYSGCVEDGRKQLMTKYTAWQSLQASAPERDQKRREFFVAECQQDFKALDEIKTQSEKLSIEIAQERKTLLAADSAEQYLAKSKALNFVVCE